MERLYQGADRNISRLTTDIDPLEDNNRQELEESCQETLRKIHFSRGDFYQFVKGMTQLVGGSSLKVVGKIMHSGKLSHKQREQAVEIQFSYSESGRAATIQDAAIQVTSVKYEREVRREEIAYDDHRPFIQTLQHRARRSKKIYSFLSGVEENVGKLGKADLLHPQRMQNYCRKIYDLYRQNRHKIK